MNKSPFHLQKKKNYVVSTVSSSFFVGVSFFFGFRLCLHRIHNFHYLTSVYFFSLIFVGFSFFFLMLRFSLFLTYLLCFFLFIFWFSFLFCWFSLVTFLFNTSLLFIDMMYTFSVHLKIVCFYSCWIFLNTQSILFLNSNFGFFQYMVNKIHIRGKHFLCIFYTRHKQFFHTHTQCAYFVYIKSIFMYTFNIFLKQLNHFLCRCFKFPKYVTFFKYMFLTCIFLFIALYICVSI